jgi:vitamin B12 transporter
MPVARIGDTDLAADLGQRVSRFTSYGTQWSGKAGASARVGERLEADAGLSTGFKAPSLASLYAPPSGNPDLRPEESVQLEAGVSAMASRRARIGLRGFASRIRNRFDFLAVAPYRSVNVERAEIEGLELEAELRLAEAWRLRPHLTRLHTKDRKTGFALRDQPEWKGGAKLEWDPNEELSVVLSALGKSSRVASSSGGRVAGFSRYDLSTRRKLSDAIAITTRLENVLDRDYQEIAGYSTPGFSAFVGFEYRER